LWIVAIASNFSAKNKDGVDRRLRLQKGIAEKRKRNHCEYLMAGVI
jgi:hypothetical protein